MKKGIDLNDVFIAFESILLLLGQLGRINLPYGISFYLLEVIVFLHVVFLLAKNRAKLKTSNISLLAKTGILWTVLAIAVLSIQTFSFSAVENIRAFSYLLRVVNFAFFAYLLAQKTPKKTLDVVISVISFFLPLVALLQYFILPDLRFLASYGWDPHMYRAVGTIFDPPIMGSVLGMLLTNQIIKKSNNKKSILSLRGTCVTKQSQNNKFLDCHSRIYDFAMNYWNTLIILLLYLSIIFLFSRSTYVAVFTVVNYLLIIRKKYLISLFFSLFIIISVYFAPQTIPEYRQLESAKIERISTVTSRKTEILAGIDAFIKNPIWGIGYNRVREYKINLKFQVPSSKFKNEKNNSLTFDLRSSILNHAGSAFHSFWITQLATTGVLGFGLLLWFFAELIRKKPLYLPILFIPAFIGFFDNTLFHPFAMYLATMLWFEE